MQQQPISRYFDYNATTPVSDEVAKIMRASIDLFANPSGISQAGTANKSLLNSSRETVAQFLSVEAHQIFFTSGGSEANNWAIKGILLQYLQFPGHIITTTIEHPSVLSTIDYCVAQFGFEVTLVPPQRNGAVAVEDVLQAIRPNTQLVSIMYANNETGVIQPVEAIAQITHEKNIKFHVDGVQVVGKRRINLTRLGIDYLSFSAHKFHGPKGIGGLYVRNIETISPLIHGGGQEMAMRSGTENLVAIVGLSKAAEEVNAHLDRWDAHCWNCKQYLISLLSASSLDVKFNGMTDYENSISNTLNLFIPGIRAEALAALMEAKHGLIVAIGSACSNNKAKKLSPVLAAMGLTEIEIQGSIRMSFGRFTTQEDIEGFVHCLETCAQQLLKVSQTT